MAERFEKRYSLPENLYIKGSPVVISAGALLKDTVTEKMLVQLKLRNIGTNMISAVKVKIKAFEPNGAEIEGVDEYQYVDLNAGHGDEFGQKTPIYLPNNSTRRFEVGVTEVVLRGSEPWFSEFRQWEPLPNQKGVKSLHNNELEKQFAIEAGGGKTLKQTPDFIPDITLDLFRCTCGDINPENSGICLSCGRKKDLVFKASDTELLKKNCDVRLEKEKRLAEQNAQEIAEKKEIQKAKIKKFRNIAIPVGAVIVVAIFLVVLFSSIIPGSKYNEAKELLNKGKYDKAYTLFSELGNYRDAKKMCDNAYYEKALNLFEKGKYKEAYSYKDKIKDEKKSEELVTEIENKISNLIDEKRYEDARKACIAIGDSTELDEVNYSEANNYYELKNYKAAKELYKKINDDNAKAAIMNCDFYIAKQELKNGNLKKYKSIITRFLTSYFWAGVGDSAVACYEFKKNGKVVIDFDYKAKWSITKSGKVRVKDYYSYLDRWEVTTFSLKCTGKKLYLENKNYYKEDIYEGEE